MNNQDRKLIFVLIGVPALLLAFFIGMRVGESEAGGAGPYITDTAVITADEFAPFWKAWRILDDKLVDAASTTAEARVWGSIQGLAASFDDPYTVFFPPEESKMFQEDISGNFEGVGMEIGIKDNQLIVVAPIKGSPAERAGVRAGDRILAIDGTITLDMPVDRAVKLIRGAASTPVEITFLPEGASRPVDKTLIRSIIDIPTLETSVKSGGIFVIRLYSFTAQSAALFRNALREFVVSGNTKLILDLRGNPGGYLDASWDMASWFLPAGAPVVTEDFGKNGKPKVYRSKGYDIFNENLRMLILVDAGSASASEILAGALKEHGVAKLVGSKTFGKGSVQELVPITPETALKVTIASWLTPNGHNLSHDGLVPDYPVEVSTTTPAGVDPTMDRAVEILRNNQ